MWEDYVPFSFGRVRFDYESVSSTNTVAFEKAAEGAPEGAVVVADMQTAGRGRMGREWVSVPGAGLFASVILRPDLPDGELGLVPLVAGVAAVRAIGSLTGLDARLKWPNDVLIDGQKVAGILTEAQFGKNGQAVVVVGIGVNLAYPADAWEGLHEHYKRASLADFGAECSASEVLEAFLRALEQDYNRLAAGEKDALVREMTELSAVIGKQVFIEGIKEVITGIAERIDESGALAVRLDSGELRMVRVGDVGLIEKPPKDG